MSTPRQILAAIFDMDGLLIDSGKRDPAGHRIVGSQIVGLDGSGGRAWNS